jgi:hypothetical protein
MEGAIFAEPTMDGRKNQVLTNALVIYRNIPIFKEVDFVRLVNSSFQDVSNVKEPILSLLLESTSKLDTILDCQMQKVNI